MEETRKSDALDAQVQALLSEETGKPKQKKRRKWKWAGGALLAVLAAAAAMRVLSGGSDGQGKPVVTEPLARGDVQEMLSVSGPVSGTDSADVMSGLHAEVTAVLVKEGDYVEKGQPLATLDEHDARQMVAEAENQVALARAARDEALKQAQAGYEKAQQAFKSAQDDFARKQALYETGDIAKAEFEQAQAALADAKAELGSYSVENGAVTVGESYALQIEAAQFALDKAQDEFAQTTVKAPIAGTVTRVNTRVGQFADKADGNATTMFSIENLDELQLEILISEYSIGKVRVGQKAAISADIMNGKTVEGEVVSISPSGEEKGGGSTERVIPTKVLVEGADSGLIPGITAKAEIVLDEAKDVWVVPISALLSEADGTTQLAFVRDGAVRMSPVTTGVESDISAEVTPVEADDANFVEGSRYLSAPELGSVYEGMPVTDALASVPNAEAEVAK